jgi:hypothetical protein
MQTAVKHTAFVRFHYDSCNQWDEDYHKKELPSVEISSVKNPKLFQKLLLA